jgi:hypothetical protein
VASEGADGMPHPNEGGTPRRLPATPVGKPRARIDGISKKAGKPAKEDRGRGGRPGRGIDE